MTEIETMEAELEYMRAGFSRKEAAKAVKADHALAEEGAAAAHAQALWGAFQKSLDALTDEQRAEFLETEKTDVD